MTATCVTLLKYCINKIINKYTCTSILKKRFSCRVFICKLFGNFVGTIISKASTKHYSIIKKDVISMKEADERHKIRLIYAVNENDHLSHVMRKPTFWFPTRSDTNQAVQLQKMARGLKFRI